MMSNINYNTNQDQTTYNASVDDLLRFYFVKIRLHYKKKKLTRPPPRASSSAETPNRVANHRDPESQSPIPHWLATSDWEHVGKADPSVIMTQL